MQYINEMYGTVFHGIAQGSTHFSDQLYLERTSDVYSIKLECVAGKRWRGL